MRIRVSVQPLQHLDIQTRRLAGEFLLSWPAATACCSNADSTASRSTRFTSHTTGGQAFGLGG